MKPVIQLLVTTACVFSAATAFADSNIYFSCQGNEITLVQYRNAQNILAEMVVQNEHETLTLGAMGQNQFPTILGDQLYGIQQQSGAELTLTAESLPSMDRTFDAILRWAGSIEAIPLSCVLY